MIILRRKQSLYIILLFIFISKTYAAIKRIHCYYADWSENRNREFRLSPKDIDATLCTHIVYAFVMPDLNDGTVPLDFLYSLTEGGSDLFSRLKRQNPDLKLMLSVGGWNEGSTRFSRIAADPEKRKWFIQYMSQLVRSLEFDGLDVNWQWPGLREGSNSADKQNYAELIMEMKRYFIHESGVTNRTRLLLSVVLPPLQAIFTKGFKLDTMLREADFLNLLTMEYHTSTGSLINQPAPLYNLPGPDFNNELTVDSTVKKYLEMTIYPGQLNLGIPFYGQSYQLESSIATSLGSNAEDEGVEGFGTKTPGTLAYFEICKYIKDEGWSVEYPNRTAMGPYAYRDKDWVAYDDADIIKKKVLYANEKGLGGIMLWTIDQDDFNGICNRSFPLTRAAKQAVDEAPEISHPRISSQTNVNSVGLLQKGQGGSDLSGFAGGTNYNSAEPLPLASGVGSATPGKGKEIKANQPINYGLSSTSGVNDRSTANIPVILPYTPNYDKDGWMLNNFFRTNQTFHYKRKQFKINKNTYYNP